MNIYRTKPPKTSKPPKHAFKVGDRVRLTEPLEAYYSNYAGNPRVVITPDLVGTIGAIDCPSVRREGIYFHCVDFTLPGIYAGNPHHGNNVWRVAARTKQIKHAKVSAESDHNI